MTTRITPPVASIRPAEIRLHGDLIVDDYAWLEQRDDPQTIAHLEAENAYTRATLEPLQPLIETLYAEMRGRIKERDSTAPIPIGDYHYYQRFNEGQDHPLLCRQGCSGGPEELLLDVNELAAGQAYCKLGPCQVSPDHTILAYGIDTRGAGSYSLRLKDLRSGELLPVVIEHVAGSVTWAEDGRTLFYTIHDHALRPYKLFRHTLGSEPSADALVHHEADESYFVYLRKTRSRAFLVMTLHSWNGSEVRYAPADRPDAPFVSLAPRQPNVEYWLDHHGDRFLIRTNDSAENFRLIDAPVADPAPERWRELIPQRDDTFLEGIDPFESYLVLYERQGGLQRIRICDPEAAHARELTFPEPVYAFTPGPNEEFASDTLRFTYSSMATPHSVIDYNMASAAWQLIKQDEIPSGHDPSRYVVERRQTSAPDGALVPISLIYRRDLQRDGHNPTLLIGYGSYGMSYDPEFDTKRFSLIDRGFVVAIAHIRGGQELGRPWYEQGRLLQKKNTFSDFIACAEHLISVGYTSPEHLVISGTSAGGLLVSACANLRPELFRAVLGRVPWTNVIAGMIKPDLPLTVIEWDQWGNPAIEEQYRYMCGYDPYQNVTAQDYPHIMATAGLNDGAVPYWDPAKWVARLRACKTDRNMLLLRTNMAAGHKGTSGRFSFLREIAEEYAFILKALEVVA